MCPGVDNTAACLARLAGCDPESTAPAFVVTGIDHGSFFTSLTCGGVDVLARLKELGYCRSDDQLPAAVSALDRQAAVVTGYRAVFAAWRELGYMPAISDRHAVENWPWILNREGELPFGIVRTTVKERQAAYERCRETIQGYLAGRVESSQLTAHGAGPLTALMHARAGGPGTIFTANYRNQGQIPGFPPGAVVETRCRFDAAGVQPLCSPMPDLLRAIVLPQVLRQERVVDIALHGSFDELVALVATDPLCARLLFGQVRTMVRALLKANRDWLENPRLLDFS
jgi:alpha-galactosidase/6-phospho-beta-glucosidase family protein